MHETTISGLYEKIIGIQKVAPLSNELLDAFISLREEIQQLLLKNDGTSEEKVMSKYLNLNLSVYELFTNFVEDGYNQILSMKGSVDDKLRTLGIINYRINKSILPPDEFQSIIRHVSTNSGEGIGAGGKANSIGKRSFDVTTEYPKTMLLVKILFEAGIGSNNYIVITGSADSKSLRPLPYRIFFIPGCATIIINDGINQATFLSDECLPIGNLLEFGKSSLKLLKKINRRSMDSLSRETQIMQFINNLDLSKKTDMQMFEKEVRSVLYKECGKYCTLLSIDDRVQESKSQGFYKQNRSIIRTMDGGYTFLRYFQLRNKQFSLQKQEIHRGLLFARICKSLSECTSPDHRMEYAKEHLYFGKNTSELGSISGGLNFYRKLKKRSLEYYDDSAERDKFMYSILQPKVHYAVNRKNFVHSGTTIENRLTLKSNLESGLITGLTTTALRNEFIKRNKNQINKKGNAEKMYPRVRHDRSNLDDEQWDHLLSHYIHPISGKMVTRSAQKAYKRYKGIKNEKM